MATDKAMAWDAMADGVLVEELVEVSARAQFAVNKFFAVDRFQPVMVAAVVIDLPEPVVVRAHPDVAEVVKTSDLSCFSTATSAHAAALQFTGPRW